MMSALEHEWAHDGGDMEYRRETAFVATRMDASRSWELNWRECFVRVGEALWMWRKLWGAVGEGRDYQELDDLCDEGCAQGDVVRGGAEILMWTQYGLRTR